MDIRPLFTCQVSQQDIYYIQSYAKIIKIWDILMTNFRAVWPQREVCKSFSSRICPLNVISVHMELPMYTLLAQKPSIIIRDRDKVSKQYSAIHFPLKSWNDLSISSLVAIQTPRY